MTVPMAVSPPSRGHGAKATDSAAGGAAGIERWPMSNATMPCVGRTAMRHDPATGAIVVMLRALKCPAWRRPHGMAVAYALLTDIHSYTGVAEMGWLTQILAMGWRRSPLGLPKPVGKSLIGALQIHIGSESINLLRQAGTYSTSGLQFGRHR